ncbi:CREB/ATF bZIP transcription factor isoform X2 [Latimeria chalumnae]|uniref:X-box-binding protein 1 n=1 Tax=Latimeria chalumnae TaxID=7897 RepID=H3B9R1_LATCH|nr:PREDICTED: CREB/ATF bZIP transcription factor isoform X2 [Latimeria chalumnae]|eukprot:XP_014343435.1 PREDICTED: CREB/ATF bZIP transcription factor isoform X2 [Latimeria chalumnae]
MADQRVHAKKRQSGREEGSRAVRLEGICCPDLNREKLLHGPTPLSPLGGEVDILSDLDVGELLDFENFNWNTSLDHETGDRLGDGLDCFLENAVCANGIRGGSDSGLLHGPNFSGKLSEVLQNSVTCGNSRKYGCATLPENPSGKRSPQPSNEETLMKNNRNAIAARLNRLKKKEYITGLENKVSNLMTENQDLKQENKELNKRVEELEEETKYLKAVLANESVLAQLLNRLTGVNGVKLSSSLFGGSTESDHDYALPRKRSKVEGETTRGGVCLHVDKDLVSVEFCSKCAQSACSSFKM